MSKTNPKKKRPIAPCRWIREHNASMKPTRDRKVKIGEFTYWRLSTGQIVSDLTARKMGI